jgi:hypothetical protein
MMTEALNLNKKKPVGSSKVRNRANSVTQAMTCTSQREGRGRRGNMPSHIPRPPHSIRGVEIKLHIFLTLTQSGGE